jgi:hypothetical protein
MPIAVTALDDAIKIGAVKSLPSAIILGLKYLPERRFRQVIS